MKNQTIRKPGLAILAVALVLLASAAPAAAQASRPVNFNIQFPVGFVGVDNPCTGGFDDIDLTGTAHIQGKIVVNNNGNANVVVHLNIHVSGMDSAGLQYVGNAVVNFHGKFPAFAPISFGSQILLISQGSTDNFAINFTAHLSPNGNVNLNLANSVCRG